MQVTCNPGKPAKPAELEGTLIIEMMVVNPINHVSNKTKMKRLTLATHRCLSLDEAKTILAEFKELNAVSIKPDFINGQWVARKYL